MSDFDREITGLTPIRHRRAVARLVKAERNKRGLPSLRNMSSLRVSARAWALYVKRNSRFAHVNFNQRALRLPFVLAGRRASARWVRTSGTAPARTSRRGRSSRSG